MIHREELIRLAMADRSEQWNVRQTDRVVRHTGRAAMEMTRMNSSRAQSCWQAILLEWLHSERSAAGSFTKDFSRKNSRRARRKLRIMAHSEKVNLIFEFFAHATPLVLELRRSLKPGSLFSPPRIEERSSNFTCWGRFPEKLWSQSLLPKRRIHAVCCCSSLSAWLQINWRFTRKTPYSEREFCGLQNDPFRWGLWMLPVFYFICIAFIVFVVTWKGSRGFFFFIFSYCLSVTVKIFKSFGKSRAADAVSVLHFDRVPVWLSLLVAVVIGSIAAIVVQLILIPRLKNKTDDKSHSFTGCSRSSVTIIGYYNCCYFVTKLKLQKSRFFLLIQLQEMFKILSHKFNTLSKAKSEIADDCST